jgi:transglutaminase-like putative cysteine protease
MVGKKMDKTKKKQAITILISILLIGSILFFNPNSKPQTNVDDNNLDSYLIEEQDFDYSEPEIQELAQELQGYNTKDSIKNVIEYVAKNVRYSGAVSVNYCYNEKASDVLASGTGDCVSMSRLVTALLRAQEIPARTKGGCLSFNKFCTPLFATVPGETAKSVAMEEGDFKKRGFLHEWVEAFDGENWVLIEATSGQVFPSDCTTYLSYGYDSNRYDRCVINDRGFWQQCTTY